MSKKSDAEQIDILLDGVSSGSVKVPEPVGPEEIKEAKGKTGVPEEAVKKDEPEPEPEEEEEEEEEEQEQEEDEDEQGEEEKSGIEVLLETNRALLEEVKRLRGEGDEKGDEEEGEEPVVLPKISFVKEDEFDGFTSAEEVNEFGGKVVQESYKAVVQALIPSLKRLIPQYVELTAVVSDFFRENPDLARTPRLKELVTTELNNVRTKYPGKPLEEQLKIAGTEVRKSLGLPGKQQTKEAPSKKDQRRRFAGTQLKGSSRTPSSPNSKVEEGSFDDQIERMLSAI